MDTNNIDVSGSALTDAENAYFESGGTTELESQVDSQNQQVGADGQSAGGEKTEAGADKDKFVPHGALHEERMRRKASDTKVRDLENQLAELRGKFSVIDRITGNGQQQTEDKSEITPESDIFGYAKKTGETVQEILSRLEKQEQEKKTTNEQTAVINNYRNDAAQFEAKTPDFKDAYGFLLNSRAQELIAFGVEDAAAITKALEDEEIQIAKVAFANKKSPAEVIYALAQQRGYKKADAGKPSAEAKIDNIEKGQAANKSLSAAGGGADGDNVTAEALLRMPIKEFEAWCEKNPAKAKRLMGG